jgi:hypothetical protein
MGSNHHFQLFASNALDLVWHLRNNVIQDEIIPDAIQLSKG